MDDDRQAPDADIPREIEILLFRSSGASMAVDASQVESIVGREQAEQRALIACALSEIMGMGPAASAACPKVIVYRDGNETYGIGIDELDSIMKIKIDAIQPLPELLFSIVGVRPFWGIILRGDEIVLLIDLYRLKGPASRRAEMNA